LSKTTAIYILGYALECRQNSHDLSTRGSPVRFAVQACWRKTASSMMMRVSFPLLIKTVQSYCLYSESHTMIAPIQEYSRPSFIFSIARIPELRSNRHRTTGYEAIGLDNKDNYKIALNRNMKNLGPPAREYTNGSNALFERMHSVDSAFNRIVIYSGNLLHAADIDGSLFSGNDNSRWRLTISSLINSTSSR